MAIFFYAIGGLSVLLSAYGSASLNKVMHLGVMQTIAFLVMSCSTGIILIGIGKILSNQEENTSAIAHQIYELKNKIDELKK